MSDDSLLHRYALVGTQLVKLAAELVRQQPAQEGCQARVELNLTPQPPDAPGGQPGHVVMAVRFQCVGLPASGREDERLFTLDIILNAMYRQERGEPVDFPTFQRLHTSLTRQLFPLLHVHASRLLAELGLHHIRLPHDLLPQALDPTSPTPGLLH